MRVSASEAKDDISLRYLEEIWLCVGLGPIWSLGLTTCALVEEE